MIEWIGFDAFRDALERVEGEVSSGARAAVTDAASRLERKAKENASTRPGPEVVTGALRRGVRTAPVSRSEIPGGWQTTVSPTTIYSRRVELGFTGTDALGRSYDQVGYPYFTPAFEEVRAELPGIFAKHWRRAIAGA